MRSFDADLQEKLTIAFSKTLGKYLQIAKTRIQTQWRRYDTIDGKTPKVNVQAFSNISTNIASAILTASGRKAWIIEFGRGSLMETDEEQNPWLSEYINSGNPMGFNTARLSRGMAILGRPAGEYYDLDGGIQVSHGRAEGRDLEQWRDRKRKAGRYATYELVKIRLPIPPYHVIRDTLYTDKLIEKMEEELINTGYNVICNELIKSTPKRVIIKI